MVIPATLHTISSRETETQYPFNNMSSHFDLQLGSPKYHSTIHRASQYYFLPVDDSRYDNRFVYSPSRRVVPSPEPTSSAVAGVNSNQTSETQRLLLGPDCDMFEVWCRKVTAIHNDPDDDDEHDNDDIEFEAIESSPRRTVSISNSTTMADASDDSYHSGHHHHPSSPQCFSDDRNHYHGIPSLEQMDIDQRLLDQGIDDIVDFHDGMVTTRPVEEHFIDETRSNPMGMCCPSPTISEHSAPDALNKEDESSDYEETSFEKKKKKKKLDSTKQFPAKKRQYRKNKKPTTSTSNNNNNNNKNNNKRGNHKTKGVKSSPAPSADGAATPLRALSAYNFFFRDERERQLQNISEMVLDDAKCEKLLEEHWYRDRSMKRRHRKSHGKIPFTQLSKIVSYQWKQLTEDQKDFYRNVSAKDWARYQQELELYKSQHQQESPVIRGCCDEPVEDCVDDETHGTADTSPTEIEQLFGSETTVEESCFDTLTSSTQV